MTDIKSLVRDVVASPLGDVIAAVGEGVAQAQSALDEGSLAAVLDLYTEGEDEKLRLLQEIGYRPTFYALPETTGEVRVALRLGQGAAGTTAHRAVKPGTPMAAGVRVTPARLGLNTLQRKLYATPVDAGYANRFGYAADISAKLTFRIVPVPAPDGADELRQVPDLTGATVADAELRLERLGLRAVFVAGDSVLNEPPETALIATQTPDAGKIARLDDAIRLEIAGA